MDKTSFFYPASKSNVADANTFEQVFFIEFFSVNYVINDTEQVIHFLNKINSLFICLINLYHNRVTLQCSRTNTFAPVEAGARSEDFLCTCQI